jgi:poly(3-hydroxybutyrate) depolymerase
VRYLLFLVLLALPLPAHGLATFEKISKQTITTEGQKRTYYLFVPDNVKTPAPLLLTLHGSGRNGLSLVEKWKDLASREGFIIAGPDSTNSQAWKTPDDGPDFLRDLVEEIRSKYPVNPRRVYLFGHSGGAVFALGMSMFESRYFAATAIHAGAWRDAQEFPLMNYAKRKIPMAIVVGDRDQFFPVSAVKTTSERLKEKGFDVEVTVLKGHGHGGYYTNASKINEQLWNRLSRFELTEEPEFEQYQFQK